MNNEEIIERHKQLDTLVLDEINVKQLVRAVANSEQGRLDLVFDRESQEYYFTLAGEKFMTGEPPRLTAMIPQLLQMFDKK